MSTITSGLVCAVKFVNSFARRRVSIWLTSRQNRLTSIRNPFNTHAKQKKIIIFDTDRKTRRAKPRRSAVDQQLFKKVLSLK